MVLPVSGFTRRHSAERSIELMEAKSDSEYDALQVTGLHRLQVLHVDRLDQVVDAPVEASTVLWPPRCGFSLRADHLSLACGFGLGLTGPILFRYARSATPKFPFL